MHRNTCTVIKVADSQYDLSMIACTNKINFTACVALAICYYKQGAHAIQFSPHAMADLWLNTCVHAIEDCKQGVKSSYEGVIVG